MENLTNYRNVYKSDHLGVIDLEEIVERKQRLIFTIDRVEQYANEKTVAVAGKRINANICYFKDGIKPLVLNSTNAKVLKMLSGSAHIEKWSGLTIELYIDPTVKMKGDTVGGVRIKPEIPKTEKPIFTEANFEKAKKANANINKIKSVYQITPDVEQKYIEYYGN
jgi:hypothetical protein